MSGGSRETVRAFVALELDAAVQAAIGRLAVDLRHRFAGLRWARPEGIHVTLRFLGDTTPAQIGRLQEVLPALAARCPPAEVGFRGLGLFPERGRPRVLWLGVALPEAMLALQSACEGAAVAAGLAAEARPFRPHLTLGRWRDAPSRPELPAADLGCAALRSLVLLQSDLRSEGAVYTTLGRFALGG